MACYLVTGGGGFIGCNIVSALLAQGEQVRVLDNFSTGRRTNLASFRSRIELIEGDIRSYHIVQEAVIGVDFVLHQAALPSVPRSVRDPITTTEVNVLGTLNLLQAARKAGVKRFIYASSSSVYGDAPILPRHESMTPNPLSPYAISKLAGEQYCHVFWRLYGFETVCLRYFNVFGPHQDPTSQYSAVIPRFITAILSNTQITIYGDGQQSRDFTYVENIVHANVLACRTSDITGMPLNIAVGARYSLIDLVNRLSDIIGVSPLISYAPPRPGDVLHSQADISAAQAGIGYEPIVGFEEGLCRTVKWFQENTA